MEKLVIALVLLGGFFLSRSKAEQFSTITCYTCSTYDDCKENADKETACPTGKNACLTRQGPGKKLSKWCAFNNIRGTFKKDGAVEGETYHWCDSDLCNKGDFSKVGRSVNEKESSGLAMRNLPSPILFFMTKFLIIIGFKME